MNPCDMNASCLSDVHTDVHTWLSHGVIEYACVEYNAFAPRSFTILA